MHGEQGDRRLKFVGTLICPLLDVSKAYDRVPWHDLVQALREAQVPESLIELNRLIHQQACVQISHNGYTDYARMGKGLRQGCGLAPILWTIYPGGS